MSMKKKFLALALAGAVAMPVIANATAPTKVEQGYDTTPIETDVNIEGTVNASNGLAPQGRLQVELPTAMAFTVDAAGNTTVGKGYNISNQGQSPIKVEVTEFRESRPDGITIVPMTNYDSTTATAGRDKVALTLKGDGSEIDLNTLATNGQAQVLFSKIEKGTSEGMTLRCVAGTDTSSESGTALQQGIQENFTVKFKISKHS